ncbi:MAG: hypothetical protein LBR89_04850 [Holosporales bacterium]|nr:hypothetical protein [Holosporales bacterium]
MNARLLLPLVITITFSGYSAETSNPDRTDAPTMFSDMENPRAISLLSSLRCLYLYEKNNVPCITWSNNPDSPSLANPELLSDLTTIYGEPGTKFLSMGYLDFEHICKILTRKDEWSIAVRLARIFKEAVIDIERKKAQGSPLEYFFPDLNNIFVKVDAKRTVFLDVVVPILTETRATLGHRGRTLAPELYGGRLRSEKSLCTEASVVYAYGVILASLLSKVLQPMPDSDQERYVVSGDQRKDLLERLSRVELQPIFGEQRIKTLISLCLSFYPTRRPTFDTILATLRPVNIDNFSRASTMMGPGMLMMPGMLEGPGMMASNLGMMGMPSLGMPGLGMPSLGMPSLGSMGLMMGLGSMGLGSMDIMNPYMGSGCGTQRDFAGITSSGRIESLAEPESRPGMAELEVDPK